MNLLLSTKGTVLDTLAWIGIVLCILLVLATVIYWLASLLVGVSGESNKTVVQTKNTTVNSNDDLALARAAIGYEKRDDERDLAYETVRAYDPVKAQEEQMAVKSVAAVAPVMPVIYNNEVQESKEHVFEDTSKEVVKNDKSDASNANDFFSQLDDGDAKSFVANANKEQSGDAFKDAGFFGDEESNVEEAFRFQDEEKEQTSNAAIVTPYVASEPVAQANAKDDENKERFDRIMELLNKNAQENKSEPRIERDLIESITREQINEMLKTKEAERNDDLSQLHRELKELRQHLKAEKNKNSESYATLVTEEQVKAEEMSEIEGEIAALKRELELEREAFKREKAEAAERAKREKIEAAEKARREEHENEMRKKLDEIEALRRELAKERQDIIDNKNKMFVKQYPESKALAVAESKDTVEIGELSMLIAELIEERKKSRAEAEDLKAELELERYDSQKKLQEQFELLKRDLEKNKKANDADEYNRMVATLRHEYDVNEKELRDQYDALKREMDSRATMSTQSNEKTEQQLKAQYDTMKINLSQDALELAEKNEKLLRELDAARAENRKVRAAGNDELLEAERIRLQEQVKAEYEENEKMLNEKYMQLRTELQRESKQLADKRDEIEQEMDALRKTQERLQKYRGDINEQSADELVQLEREKAELQREIELRDKELVKTQAEAAKARADMREIILKSDAGMPVDDRMVRDQLQREYNEKEKALIGKYEEMQAELEKEEEQIKIRHSELLLKEKQIREEASRIQEESSNVTTLITEKVYTVEERNRILMDYRSKLDVLQERLRINEKAIRDNNKEFVPLRRIKDTLDRDLKLMRKREAIIAKQQVLVYGVNNITELNPERVKKLEQDVQQLSGLQQSVANCEDILLKNKDRYPTLENLSKVLTQQNKQLRGDIEEIEQAISFFESNATVE